MTSHNTSGGETAPSAPSAETHDSPRVSRVNPRGIVRSQPDLRTPSVPVTGRRSPHRPAFLDDAIEARRRGEDPLAGARRPQGQPQDQSQPPLQPQQFLPQQQPPPPWHQAPSAPSGPSAGPLYAQPWSQHRPAGASATIMILAVIASYLGAILVAVATWVPFLSSRTAISLWDSVSGRGNATVALTASGIAAVSATLVVACLTRAPALRWTGVVGLAVSGIVATVLVGYLLTLPVHRHIIAEGGQYGAGLWLLVGGAATILVASIAIVAQATQKNK